MKSRAVYVLLFAVCLTGCQGLTYTPPGATEAKPLTSPGQLLGLPAPEEAPARAARAEAPARTASATVAPAGVARPRAVTPQAALQMLKDGNARMVSGQTARRDLTEAARQAAGFQHPFASVLGCSDSQAAPELVFDLGLGDLFTVRVAGNVVNENVLGSLEFAAKHLGSKLILVLGHTQCDAIKAACDNTQLGNFSSVVNQIGPVISQVSGDAGPRNSRNPAFVQQVTDLNVRQVMKQIRDQSSVLRELLDKGEIALSGAMLDVKTGRVTFF